MTGGAYYNEIDPYAAQWLRNLIAAGHIAPGDVDTRSIADVRPDDLKPYAQCHFFAGIGGWSHALRLAGWADERPVWTGSCPCQPFSAAGKQQGIKDDRHLWPVWFDLIRECRPDVIFGEQVAAAVEHGWLDLVSADLEGEGYAVGAAILGAHSVGAPHIRQRLWFVADDDDEGLERRQLHERQRPGERAAGAGGDAGVLGIPHGAGSPAGGKTTSPAGHRSSDVSASWVACDWLPCRDGKSRPVEPGTFPLAHGVPNRVGRLRAYGNAIVPQVAAEVIAAYMECRL